MPHVDNLWLLSPPRRRHHRRRDLGLPDIRVAAGQERETPRILRVNPVDDRLPPSPFTATLPAETSAPMASAAFIPSSDGLRIPEFAALHPSEQSGHAAMGKRVGVSPTPSDEAGEGCLAHAPAEIPNSAVGARPADEAAVPMLDPLPGAAAEIQSSPGGRTTPVDASPSVMLACLPGDPAVIIPASPGVMTAGTIPETCFDCGERDPCDDDCPNFIDRKGGDPSDLPADAAQPVAASADPIDCIHHIFDAASGMCAKAELERSRFVPDYEAINRAILDEYAPRTALEAPGAWKVDT